jgi:hypothetical protein
MVTAVVVVVLVVGEGLVVVVEGWGSRLLRSLVDLPHTLRLPEPALPLSATHADDDLCHLWPGSAARRGG